MKKVNKNKTWENISTYSQRINNLFYSVFKWMSHWISIYEAIEHEKFGVLCFMHCSESIKTPKKLKCTEYLGSDSYLCHIDITLRIFASCTHVWLLIYLSTYLFIYYYVLSFFLWSPITSWMRKRSLYCL